MLNRRRAICETIHLTALGLWFGVLVMTGVAAAILFPTMKEAKPTLPDYSSYNGEHWLIAAGQVAAKLFFICDAVQLVCGMLCGATLGAALLLWRDRAPRWGTKVRVAGLVIALAALGFQLYALGPRMHGHMRAHWEAAHIGDNEAAAHFKAAFDADHHIATKVLGTGTVGVLIALVAGAWVMATPERNAAAETARRKS